MNSGVTEISVEAKAIPKIPREEAIAKIVARIMEDKAGARHLDLKARIMALRHSNDAMVVDQLFWDDINWELANYLHESLLTIHESPWFMVESKLEEFRRNQANKHGFEFPEVSVRYHEKKFTFEWKNVVPTQSFSITLNLRSEDFDYGPPK